MKGWKVSGKDLRKLLPQGAVLLGLLICLAVLVRGVVRGAKDEAAVPAGLVLSDGRSGAHGPAGV